MTNTQENNMASVMERNIEALFLRRKNEERNKNSREKLAASITRFAGSMTFVIIHLILFGLWIILNLDFIPFPKFDPTFVVLAMFASVEAIFLSTFVLITQNRMQELADQRADLDLQVSLLAEHEVTKLITLVGAVAEHLGVDISKHPDIHELKKDVDPEQVLDKIEESKREFDKK